MLFDGVLFLLKIIYTTGRLLLIGDMLIKEKLRVVQLTIVSVKSNLCYIL
jgi:hypothetical protein